jgi:hypothetical protein
VAFFHTESSACSNQIWISATMTCSGLLRLIAERSIHPWRSRGPRGRKPASSIGGLKKGGSGGAGYAAQTAANGGSELLIFVPRAAPSHDCWCCESHTTWTG